MTGRVLLEIRGVRRARLLGRPTRFTVELEEPGGARRLCHLHDPGRLRHLLARGAAVYYVERWRPGRRTGCDVVAVEEPGTGALVLEDTRLGNRLFPRAAPLLAPWLAAARLEPERQINGARIDFAGSDPSGRPLLVEVKSTNLAEAGVALFPDAPSRRAVRQLEALAAAAAAGARAVIVFTVLRGDASRVRPNRRVDPLLASRLCSLVGGGVVEALGYRVEPLLLEGGGGGARIAALYGGRVAVEPC